MCTYLQASLEENLLVHCSLACEAELKYLRAVRFLSLSICGSTSLASFSTDGLFEGSAIGILRVRQSLRVESLPFLCLQVSRLAQKLRKVVGHLTSSHCDIFNVVCD
jgi:hypothetical protein